MEETEKRFKEDQTSTIAKVKSEEGGTFYCKFRNQSKTLLEKVKKFTSNVFFHLGYSQVPIK